MKKIIILLFLWAFPWVLLSGNLDERVPPFAIIEGSGANRTEAIKDALDRAVYEAVNFYSQNGWEFEIKEAAQKIKGTKKFVKNQTILAGAFVGGQYIVRVKAWFEIEAIEEELKLLIKEKPKVPNDKKDKMEKDSNMIVKATGQGPTREDAIKKLYKNAVSKASPKIVGNDILIKNETDVQEWMIDLNIGFIKKVTELKVVEKNNVFVAEATLEIETTRAKKGPKEEVEIVIVEAEGLDEENAIKNGAFQAVERVSGIFIKNVEMVNQDIIKNELKAETSGYIYESEILNIAQIKGGKKYTIKYTVNKKKILEKLKSNVGNKISFDGVSIAAMVASKEDLSVQCSKLISLMLEDYCNCFVMKSLGDNNQLNIQPGGAISINFEIRLSDEKYNQFCEKWTGILEKIGKKYDHPKYARGEPYTIFVEPKDFNYEVVVNFPTANDKITSFAVPCLISKVKFIAEQVVISPTFELLGKNNEQIFGVNYDNQILQTGIEPNKRNIIINANFRNHTYGHVKQSYDGKNQFLFFNKEFEDSEKVYKGAVVFSLPPETLAKVENMRFTLQRFSIKFKKVF